MCPQLWSIVATSYKYQCDVCFSIYVICAYKNIVPYIQGVPEKNGTKFAASHFCNRKSQSHAIFNKMSRNILLTQLNAAVEYFFVLQLTSELFKNKVNRNIFS